MRTVTWRVRLLSPPPVLRHCKKCGQTTEYHSSGLFRVNAQRKSLDIWLIYKCTHCDTTWNAEIYSRIRPQSLSAELLHRFVNNEEGLALRCAVDLALLTRLGAEMGEPEYEITGEKFSLEEPITLQIQSDFSLPVKVSSLLRDRLELSNRQYSDLLVSGRLKAQGGENLKKCRLHQGITLIFSPCRDHGEADG